MDSSVTQGIQEQSMKNSNSNITGDDLPIDMQFNEGHVISIVVYSVLLVIGAAGNIMVLSLLTRRGAPRTRINTMLIHLAIADLMVIFILMPLEIAWAATVQWRAGDAMCRIMSFLRIFGLYLSSFVLVCISIDRYFAVLKPLKLTGSERRGRIMLMVAWTASLVCSIPQAKIFHLAAHPTVKWYLQCVSFDAFMNDYQQLAYNLFHMIMMYGLPLITFIYCYTSILIEIIRRSKDSIDNKIRRSSLGFLGRAKIRTLKMTITIVAVFFICWTPYYIMCLWYWLENESAKRVDVKIQKALFLFASTNSCMNPLVYGAFNVRARTQEIINTVPSRKDLYSCGEIIELPTCVQNVRRK